MMRCFIAIDVENPVKEKIINLQKGLSSYDIKLTAPENLHITLKFLGEIASSDIDFIESKIDKIAHSFQSFGISVTGCGVFPDLNHIRVVFLGMESNEILNLQNAIDSSLQSHFKKYKSSLHLTLGRLKSAEYKKEIIDFVEKNKDIKIGDMTISRIKLKKSTLAREGPIYEDLKVFELQRNDK